jgi:hypothetical protein
MPNDLLIKQLPVFLEHIAQNDCPKGLKVDLINQHLGMPLAEAKTVFISKSSIAPSITC